MVKMFNYGGPEVHFTSANQSMQKQVKDHNDNEERKTNNKKI